jgi:hypothetical protein
MRTGRCESVHAVRPAHPARAIQSRYQCAGAAQRAPSCHTQPRSMARFTARRNSGSRCTSSSVTGRPGRPQAPPDRAGRHRARRDHRAWRSAALQGRDVRPKCSFRSDAAIDVESWGPKKAPASICRTGLADCILRVSTNFNWHVRPIAYFLVVNFEKTALAFYAHRAEANFTNGMQTSS